MTASQMTPFPIERYAASIAAVRRAEAAQQMTPAESLERREQLWRLGLAEQDAGDFALGYRDAQRDRADWLRAQETGDTVSMPYGLDLVEPYARGYSAGWEAHRREVGS